MWDTAISLHTLQLQPLGGGVFLGSQNTKCQGLPKFELGGGGGFLGSQNSNCQDLPKFELGGGFLGSKNSKC